jgi:hypothetical protein
VIKPHPKGGEQGFDTAMDDTLHQILKMVKLRRLYSTEYKLDPPVKLPSGKAQTTDSDLYDYDRWNKRDRSIIPPPSKRDPIYSTPRPLLPSMVDIATWFIDMQNGAQWPGITEARIRMAMNDEFIERYQSEGAVGVRKPVDSLVNMDFVILHEASHHL